MIKIKNANFICTMTHVKLQNFDPEQIEFLARVSEQIGLFYIIYTPGHGQRWKFVFYQANVEDLTLTMYSFYASRDKS